MPVVRALAGTAASTQTEGAGHSDRTALYRPPLRSAATSPIFLSSSRRGRLTSNLHFSLLAGLGAPPTLRVAHQTCSSSSQGPEHHHSVLHLHHFFPLFGEPARQLDLIDIVW
jgi:hypothetical protein